MGFLTLETKELKKTEKRDLEEEEGVGEGVQTNEHYYGFYIKAPWSTSITENTRRLRRETFFRRTLLRFSSPLPD